MKDDELEELRRRDKNLETKVNILVGLIVVLPLGYIVWLLVHKALS